MKWCETGCSGFDQGAEKGNSTNLEVINVPYKWFPVAILIHFLRH